jgi:hypothetical protein
MNTYELIENAKQEFNTVTLPWLERNGMRIGKEANEGNTEARKIIDAYTLLHARFEQAAYGILCAAIEIYKRDNQV